MSNVVYVSDDQEFQGHLDTAGNDLVVVDFFTTWCGPCKKMEGPLTSLAMKYPSVLFLKVDADLCFESAMRHDLKGVPLFVLYRNNVMLDQVQGAKPDILDAMISQAETDFLEYLQHKNPEAYERKKDSSPHNSLMTSSASHEIGQVTEISEEYLDLEKCQIINDLGPTPMEGFLSGRKLISGSGMGKLLMVYAFKEKLSLHSFIIRTNPPNSGPKILRIFANHPKVLDINAATHTVPSQEVTLSTSDLSGEIPIQFRAGGFSLVTNLQILVTDVISPSWKSSGYHRVDIDFLKVFGAPVILKDIMKDSPLSDDNTKDRGRENILLVPNSTNVPNAIPSANANTKEVVEQERPLRTITDDDDDEDFTVPSTSISNSGGGLSCSGGTCPVGLKGPLGSKVKGNSVDGEIFFYSYTEPEVEVPEEPETRTLRKPPPPIVPSDLPSEDEEAPLITVKNPGALQQGSFNKKGLGHSHEESSIHQEIAANLRHLRMVEGSSTKPQELPQPSKGPQDYAEALIAQDIEAFVQEQMRLKKLQEKDRGPLNSTNTIRMMNSSGLMKPQGQGPSPGPTKSGNANTYPYNPTLSSRSRPYSNGKPSSITSGGGMKPHEREKAMSTYYNPLGGAQGQGHQAQVPSRQGQSGTTGPTTTTTNKPSSTLKKTQKYPNPNKKLFR